MTEIASAIAGKVAGGINKVAEGAGKASGMMEPLGRRLVETGTKAKSVVEGAKASFAKGVQEAKTPALVTSRVDGLANGDRVTEDGKAQQLGEQLTTGDDKGAENTDKVRERVVDNRNRRLGEAVKRTDEQLGITDDEKDSAGLPTDESKRTEYVRALAENSEKAEDQALEDTIRQQYEADYPPPQDNNPTALAEWSKGYNVYLESMDEAKQEAQKAAKEEESGVGAAREKATKPKTEEETEADESEEEKETEEDVSASMSNAFRLANELEKAENDKSREKIEGKIETIHNTNQKSNPKFKTKVTICKTILMGRAIALMSAMGVASSAVNQVK